MIHLYFTLLVFNKYKFCYRLIEIITAFCFLFVNYLDLLLVLSRCRRSNLLFCKLLFFVFPQVSIRVSLGVKEVPMCPCPPQKICRRAFVKNHKGRKLSCHRLVSLMIPAVVVNIVLSQDSGCLRQAWMLNQ
jgi:hypothetical protein